MTLIGCCWQLKRGAWLGSDVARDRLLCTEHQLAQGSNDVSTLVAFRDGRRGLPWPTAENSQVLPAYNCLLFAQIAAINFDSHYSDLLLSLAGC